MNRESKMGLLVGLAFLIAVCILLSDFVSTSEQPPAARLQLAGSAVRQSLGDGGADAGGDPVGKPAAVVSVPPEVTPAQPVPTAGELASRARRAAVAAAVPVVDPAAIPPQALAAETVPVPSTVAPVPPALNPDLAATARHAGEALVAPKHAAGRTVVAEPGDALGDLAERAYGSNTKATRDAMAAANPSLTADRNHVVAGRAYAVGTAPPAAAVAKAPAAKPAATAVVMYTVQDGDTLWSIAADEVGTPRAVAAIRDLNRDTLHGDHLRTHMRLRLPKRAAD